MAAKPQLLFVCPIAPSRGGNGLAMRGGVFLEAFSEAFEVSVRVIPVADMGRQYTIEQFARPLSRDAEFLPPAVGDRLEIRKDLPVLAAVALSGETTRGLASSMKGREFDALFVQRAYLAPVTLAALELGRGLPDLRILDLDDDEAESARRLASLYIARGHPDRSLAFARQAHLYEKFLTIWLPRFGTVCVCSQADAEQLRDANQAVNFCAIPNTASGPARVSPGPDAACKVILFVGGLSYEPNTDAAEALALEILPRIRALSDFPVELVIAGSDPPERVRRLGELEGVSVPGYVERLEELYAGCDVVAVPLRAGAGTRIKILEAFAHGRPVVSSAIGAEGIEAESGKELVIADDPDAFAECCARLLSDRQAAQALSAAGRALFTSRYERSIVKSKVQSMVDAMRHRDDSRPVSSTRIHR